MNVADGCTPMLGGQPVVGGGRNCFRASLASRPLAAVRAAAIWRMRLVESIDRGVPRCRPSRSEGIGTGHALGACFRGSLATRYWCFTATIAGAVAQRSDGTECDIS